MVERRMELKRRYHRKKKMAKLKARMAATKDNSKKEHLLQKIHLLSPWWRPEGTAKAEPAAKAEASPRKPAKGAGGAAKH